MIDLVLFYSQQCQHCKNVIIAIQKSSLQDSIKMFCIDGFHPLPPFLKSVPTLKSYLKNQILVGDEILEWLDSQKKPLQEIIQDQIAQSTGGYTMLNGGQEEVNEIDAVYNARISTPQGQMPTKEGPTSSGPVFPQEMEKMQSGGLDMAFEKMMQEREKQFPTASPENMDKQFEQMMDQRNNQVTTL